MKELTEELLMDLPRGMSIKVKDSVECPQVFKDGGILVHQSEPKYKDDKRYGIKTLIGTCYEFKADDYELIVNEEFLSIYERIIKWEEDAGESFTDYFMHDNVRNQSWAFWLLGKGYTERANQIIDEIINGEECIDQELLYELYDINEGPDYHTPFLKNVALWAEFLSATPTYVERVNEFFENN